MALYDLDNRTRAFGVARRWKDADGQWRSEAKHKGDDYAETYGNDPVRAVQPGKVTAVGKSSVYGNYLHVRRDARTVIRYHMFHSLPSFRVGDDIEAGDLLGRTGASAANASGNHIHIQVEVNGVPVDPRPYIAGADFSAIPVAKPAAVAVEPLKDDDMFKLIRLADAGKKDEIWIVGTKGRAHVTSPYHKQLLERFQKGNDLLQAEIDVVVSYLSRVS